jgi:hypothetical protein
MQQQKSIQFNSSPFTIYFFAKKSNRTTDNRKRLKPSAFFITLLTSITTERGVDLKSLKPVSVNHIRFAACRTHCGKLENGPG